MDLESDFDFFLSLERMVGGSCIGSPARMSFLALKMGIQHTFSGEAEIFSVSFVGEAD